MPRLIIYSFMGTGIGTCMAILGLEDIFTHVWHKDLIRYLFQE